MGAHRANNFDLLRLVAALQVAVFHSFTWLGVDPPWVKTIASVSAIFPGVAVFFIISGFLVTQSYLRCDGALVRYFSFRALRIYPALWLQYILVIVLMAVTGGFHLATLADGRFWEWLVLAGTIGSNFWPGALLNFNPFDWSGLYKWYPADVLWTIPVELGFYILVPLVFARILRDRGLDGIVAAVAFAISVLFLFRSGTLLRNSPSFNTTGMLASSPLPYFCIFLMGALAARHWEQVRWLFEGRAWIWLGAHLVLSGVALWLSGSVALRYRYPDWLTLFRVVTLAGVVLALAHSKRNATSWMRGVDLSYGIYLFHLPFPFGIHYAGLGGHVWLMIPSMLIALALAALSWVLVERPALALKDRFRNGPAMQPVMAARAWALLAQRRLASAFVIRRVSGTEVARPGATSTASRLT